ncbi:hypothetical protein Dimus_035832 [Dionaea muscipula]
MIEGPNRAHNPPPLPKSGTQINKSEEADRSSKRMKAESREVVAGGRRGRAEGEVEHNSGRRSSDYRSSSSEENCARRCPAVRRRCSVSAREKEKDRGPSLRNSVVSPKIGQPMVPGGTPFFLYLSSFHLNKAMVKKQRPRVAIRATMRKAIDDSFCFLAPEAPLPSSLL